MYGKIVSVIVHILLFEAYKLVYFLLHMFSFFSILHHSPRLAYAICELYMFIVVVVLVTDSNNTDYSCFSPFLNTAEPSDPNRPRVPAIRYITDSVQ